MKVRTFEYKSGKIVWVIDPYEIHSSPYGDPFDDDDYKVCCTYNINKETEKVIQQLVNALPFKHEKNRTFPYFWLESRITTLRELVESAGIEIKENL
jgi:hypothetical protein